MPDEMGTLTLRSGPTISHEEWEAYVATDPEVTRDPNNTGNDYLWQTGNQEWPLWWMDGEVFTKNPSDTAMIKGPTLHNLTSFKVEDVKGGSTAARQATPLCLSR
jgi:hypothetical protein